MSELSDVINLTNFQGLSTGSRKAVENPAGVRAHSALQLFWNRMGIGAGI